MTTRARSKFLEKMLSFSHKLVFWKKEHHLDNEKLALAPIDDSMPQSTITKNVVAETIDEKTQHKRTMLVEIESFTSTTYVADFSPLHQVKVTNYTREGDDPNLRITHYPPSNLVH